MGSDMRSTLEHVICGPEKNFHTTVAYSAHTFSALDLDSGWSFEKFREGFRISITALDAERAEFDLVGVLPAIANALRRVMIAEVPTMAIEHVYFVDNTGVVQDEVLAHRLGLVPILADPRLFERKRGDEASNERNCIVFKLDVTCRRHKGVLSNTAVMSGGLEWLPEGSEMPDETNCRFTGDQSRALVQDGDPITLKPVHHDILLTKMQNRQAIQLEAHCFKGIGKDHAKWSPVATAWYRLHPEVILLKEVQGAKATYLADHFPGLFTTQKKSESDTIIAHVADARGHERYLEEIRHLSGEPGWESKIQYRKQKDYFLYTVESVGQYRPEEIFLEALDVLIHKCDKLISAL